jgi:DNA repair protein SbcD/Mre11
LTRTTKNGYTLREMLKLIHFSDVHLGIEAYGRLDSATGMSTRLGDFLSTFDEVVDYCIGQKADLVVFAGDAYKTRDPNPTVQREFARRIKKLSAAGIPTVLLVGNHDIPNAQARANSIDIFETLEVENVTVCRTPGAHLIITPKGPVQVVALPWVMRSTFLTKEDMRGKSLEELDKFMLDRIGEFLDRSAASIDRSIPAVLAAHASVFGADYGSEKSVMLGNDVVIGRGLIANPVYDYVALGHIHKHQVLREKPLVAYSGSLERVDFGEEKEDKGFMEVDLDETMDSPGRVTDYSFVPVTARSFLTIHIVLDSEVDPTEKVLTEIESHQSQVDESIVRLIIDADNDSASRLRTDDVRRALKSACYVAAIKVNVARTARSRLGIEMIEELDPREALEKYLAYRNIPPDRTKTLLEQAERLFHSVEQQTG